MRRANTHRFRRGANGQTPTRKHFVVPNRGNGQGRKRAIDREKADGAARVAYYASTPTDEVITRQVRRAQERLQQKARSQRGAWGQALAAPDPDPPARLRACAKVIAQKRGHRRDW